MKSFKIKFNATVENEKKAEKNVVIYAESTFGVSKMKRRETKLTL
jgi:hypothetical protein